MGFFVTGTLALVTALLLTGALVAAAVALPDLAEPAAPAAATDQRYCNSWVSRIHRYSALCYLRKRYCLRDSAFDHFAEKTVALGS